MCCVLCVVCVCVCVCVRIDGGFRSVSLIASSFWCRLSFACYIYHSIARNLLKPENKNHVVASLGAQKKKLMFLLYLPVFSGNLQSVSFPSLKTCVVGPRPSFLTGNITTLERIVSVPFYS